MKDKQSLSRVFLWFYIALVILLTLGAYLIYSLYSNAQDIRHLEAQRFVLVAKANELRKSSDLLTSFARQYVVTGDEKYRDQFNQVLAIRLGQQPRPDHYQGVYWDLQEPIRSERHPPLEKEVLHDVILSMPYSKEEIAFLIEAEQNSNHLVNLEVEAFNAIDGKFKQLDGSWKEGKSNPDYAITLLFSKEYEHEKHMIMLPIDKFLMSLERRLYKEISAKEDRELLLLEMLPIGFIVIIALVFYLFKYIRKQVDTYSKKLEEYSFTDHLTGAYNRRYLYEIGNALLSLSRREKSTMAALVLDIDHFKNINDSYGHDAGDEVLVEVSHAIKNCIRESDMFFRYGGEEFVILVKNSNRNSAQEFSEKIRKVIEDLPIYLEDEKTIKCTISLGVCTSKHNDELQNIISRADRALYRAKIAGRNQVVMADVD